MEFILVNSYLNKAFTFPSPAKLNLFLHIVGQREDGYHNLQSVFQFLDFGDSITISPNTSGNINLLTHFEGVPPESNLIVKAAKLLQQHTHTAFGADISIEKHLPMGGGLGGGSSNAATILVALNKLWQTALSTKALAKLGLVLGADVPIFVEGFAAFAEGVGEKLTPVEPEECWYLVSKPELSISTASVFTAPDLTRNTPEIKVDDWCFDNTHNDCEDWVIKHHPEVANLLAWLVEYAPSQMTGTGACIFTRCQNQEEARNIQAKLPQGTSSFIAKGANTSPLKQAINQSFT